MKLRRLALTFLGILLLSTGIVGLVSGQKPSEQVGSTTAYLPGIFNMPFVQTIFGVQVSSIDERGGVDKLTQAGTTWVRAGGAEWAAVEPNEGERNWGALASRETEWIEAAQSGLLPVVTIAKTPSWAQKVPGYSCSPVKSDKLEAFARFVTDLVQRYSQPPYNVKYWELWNEPDIAPDPAVISPESWFGCWGDPDAPYYGGRYYGEMLKVIYPAIKQADPEAQVLVGGLLLDCDPRLDPSPGGKDCSPSKFLEGILLAGAGNSFDGISFHAYDYYTDQGTYSNGSWQSTWNTTGPVLIAKSDFLRDTLNRYGVSGKYLMNTEVALLCPSCSNDELFETTKANYLAEAYAAALAKDFKANIWFSLYGWDGSGLVSSDGGEKPAYDAFRIARLKLGKATFIREITEHPGVKGYAFDRADDRLWVIRSLDGSPKSVTLPSTPQAIYDAQGNKLPAENPLPVDANIRYVELNK